MLKSNGKWYSKSRNHKGRKKQSPIKMKQYKTTACKTCPVYDLCTRAKNKRGRVIERLVYAHLLEKNKQRMKEYYRSEEHTSELQSRGHLVCRLLLEKK